MWKLLVRELERPREKRPFGSGWISGTLSILAGITAFCLIAIRAFPETFTMPEFATVHGTTYSTIALRVVLAIGYGLALLSLLLDRRKILGFFGLSLAVIGALLSSVDAVTIGVSRQSLYFGLDYFVINVIVIGFLFIPLERFFPHKGAQTVFRPEWEEDLFYYLVSSMLVQILSFLTLAPANFVNTSFDLTDIRTYIGELPFVVQVLIIMFATDLVQYWVHRLFHTVPFLWRFHSIHHSTKSLDWLAGARMHFLEIAILRGLTAVPMFTLGFKPEAIQAYLLVVYFYSSFVHSNIGWNLNWVERWLVTPRFHHWHHGSEREAIDINYAVHFPLFDWLFGTFHLPGNKWPEKYGVAGEEVPRGYWRQFIYPFQRKNKVPGE